MSFSLYVETKPVELGSLVRSASSMSAFRPLLCRFAPRSTLEVTEIAALSAVAGLLPPPSEESPAHRNATNNENTFRYRPPRRHPPAGRRRSDLARASQ